MDFEGYYNYDDDWAYHDWYDNDDTDDTDDSDNDDYTFTRRLSGDTDHDKQGVILKTFDDDFSALSQYYNKEEKRSTFSDITIKVQTQIYHLDKAILALKSAYFETLFTGDFEDRNYDEIEIHTIDEETFSSIVDYIYGADLDEIVDKNNFAALFVALDYLQMEINLRFFINFLNGNDELDDYAAFQLYNFVSLLSEFEAITTAIHQHFAENLRKIGNSSEFLLMAPSTLIIGAVLNVDNSSEFSLNTLKNKLIIRAVLNDIYDYGYYDPPLQNHEICEICVEWICHDFQKRLPHIIDLVNVVKRKFGIGFAISNANYRAFEEPDEIMRKKRVKKYFNRLLNHSAELRPESTVTVIGTTSESHTSSLIEDGRSKCSEYTSVHKIDFVAKWKTYFKQENFCDISIRAGDEIFRLHRIQLSLEIPYFHNVLSRSSNQNEYVLESAIDGASFKKIINFIYYEEIDLVNDRQIIQLLRSSAILRINELKNEIYQYVGNNLNLMKGIYFDFLSFTIENEDFHDNLDTLETFIGVSWQEICTEPEFFETSIDLLEYVVNLPNLQMKNEQDLLKICSNWIHYDVKYRYQFIPRLALAINRGSRLEVALEKCNLLQHEELYLTQRIEDQLRNILFSMQLVTTCTSLLACDLTEELIPHFVILKDREISIVNGKFDEIAHIPLLNPIPEYGEKFELSAAIVNDNLFTLLTLRDANKFLFQVYNIRSKKVTSLSFHSKTKLSNIHLFNHSNELYFYADEEDYIWKYSGLLNRWIRLFKTELKHLQFITSDGEMLYRVFEKHYKGDIDSEMQSYDFETQSWVKYDLLPCEMKRGSILDVSFTNANFAMLCSYCTAIYQQELREWKLITKGHDYNKFTTFKLVGDSIVYVREKNTDEKELIEFHSFSIADEKWQLKKEVQTKYKKIVPVHSG